MLRHGFSLFTGIGGIELGLRKHHAELHFGCCELDADARTVLRQQMATHATLMHDDVRTLERLPTGVQIVTAGSPCVNFSVANVSARHGLAKPGASSLIVEVFRLLEGAPSVEHVVIENVANMLTLNGGYGLRVAIEQLEALGFYWAYRTVDARAFGQRQRRRRLILVGRRASPPTWLLAENFPAPQVGATEPFAAFSWVDGHRGSGFAMGCVPTIRAHDTALRIPSQPAIVPMPIGSDERAVLRLSVEDGELLQGLPVGWTACLPERSRFCRIGNSVCVPLFEYVGQHLLDEADAALGQPVAWSGSVRADGVEPLPRAAWGGPGTAVHGVACTEFPAQTPLRDLQHLNDSPPLSLKATLGFLERAKKGKPGVPDWLLNLLARHAQLLRGSSDDDSD